MRAVALAAFALCQALAGCATVQSPTLGELIDRHTQARGGRAAIEAINSLEVKLRIVEPTDSADGVWRVDRKGRMRIDIAIDGKRVFTEGFDGERAWQQPGDAEHGAPATGAGAAALRHSGQVPTNILGLHEMTAHGHRLELDGREEVAGTLYYVTVLTLDDGSVTRYYIHPGTFLITRARVRKALHPDVDPTVTTIETVWSDFREVAGVQFAFQSTETDLATGRLLQTATLLEVRPNPRFDDALFRMP